MSNIFSFFHSAQPFACTFGDQLGSTTGIAQRRDNLCRTQVEIKLSCGGTVTDLLRAPLGNHLVLVFGHHLDRLQNWCKGAASHIVTL